VRLRLRPLFGVLVLAIPLVSGCGDGGAARFPAAGNPAEAGGNGTLAYAIPSTPSGLDPLAAGTIAAQTVSRQIFEPLVASIDGPYGQRRNVPGIALTDRHSDDFRVWSLRLRSGVRFGDGRLLDASAVLVNVRRWRASPVGRDLLPGLIAADGPRPDLVRFVFASPMRDLPSRLSDPRLGLVSPPALQPNSGANVLLLRVAQAGSGPFQLAGRSGPEIVLRRNRGWWGSRRGLGPALDKITFTAEARRRGDRLELLRRGAVEVAADIGRAAAQRLRADPLLTAVSVAGPYAIGLDRSVRGIFTWRPRGLSGVWITRLG
jgi:peptide/nickel transport system substrate-binding protein